MKITDADVDYSQAIDRSMTIDAIRSLDKRFRPDYLNSLTTDALHDLEDSLLEIKEGSC